MTNFIANHLPSLQVLIVLFAALSSVFVSSLYVKKITQFFVFGAFALSLFGAFVEFPLSYNFGGWDPHIGIEYKLDNLNQNLVIYLNGLLLFLLIFCGDLIDSKVLAFIPEHRHKLFYTILLFAHAGYVGMLSTNDLFNLYVFIEISSLATYVLLSLGGNKYSVIGAFDYLIFGSIGATLILIGIGFLFNFTGSLNITEVHNYLMISSRSAILIAGISFFVIGAMLKIACFPLHFWMIRVYSRSEPFILSYIAGISTIIGSYVTFRFLKVLGSEYLQLTEFLRVVSLITIIICSLFALTSKTIRNTILYSSAANIGYVVLLLSISISESVSLLVKFILVDSLNKVSLFMLIGQGRLSLATKIIAVIIFLCSCGMPVSAAFFIKLDILRLLINQNLYIALVVVTISSAFSVLYHYKMIKEFSLSRHIIANKSFLLIEDSKFIIIILIQFLVLFAIV